MKNVNLSDEPIENWKSVEYYMPAKKIAADDDDGLSMRSDSSLVGRSHSADLSLSFRDSIFSLRNNILTSLIQVSERPSEMKSLHDVQINDFKSQISCFL
mmetsp:Transcript_573/g.1136  ORF Transcript_573/g.1136 Transcript_573/m.1136 type:complete len:100 (-) Transcript_573:17-316(-)